MEDFEFYRPVRIHFGRGTELGCGEHIRAQNCRRVLLLYGCGSAEASGLLQRVRTVLQKADLEVHELGGIRPNPTAAMVSSAIAMIREHGLDFILALGGGSVIDTAKAAAIGAVAEGDFFGNFYLARRPAASALGIGVVLTIPGAGSECSVSSVIQQEVQGLTLKRGYSSELMLPRFAVLNPELTLNVPAYATACGVVDMMCHVMERYFTNTPEVEVTDRLCEGLLCSIIETAPRVMADPGHYEARANLMWAATLAHCNICGVGREQDWASHHLEHQLSGLYDCAHGAGLAVIFPAWMEFALSHDVMRFAQFAHRVFGISMDFSDPRRTARKGIAALRAFFRALGMPLSFADLGANADDIPLLLRMLDISRHTEGQFVVLGRRECEQVLRRAARYATEPAEGTASS